MFTAREERPRIEWTFTSSSARLLSLELRGSGETILSTGDLRFKAGQTLVLSAGDDGRMRAHIGTNDVTACFSDTAGRRPVLPKVPQGRSEWVFRAGGGFDTGFFDDDTYDLPRFRVEMQWVRYETLAFDVYAPYFLKQTVKQLAKQHEYRGELFVYEGLPLERIQEVVDQTRAAGVRGSVHFSLNFFEDHNQREQPLMIAGDHRTDEDSRLDESLLVGSVSSGLDTHDVEESFAVGGVFDISTFDQGHGFVID
jgi:hypothetical protein